jgi:hypothetical protein
MHHGTRRFALPVLLTVALLGCQSHEAKVDSLQKEYDQLGAQFKKDCSEEYLKVPPTLSPKCSDELKRLDALSKQLQDERAKK